MSPSALRARLLVAVLAALAAMAFVLATGRDTQAAGTSGASAAQPKPGHPRATAHPAPSGSAAAAPSGAASGAGSAAPDDKEKDKEKDGKDDKDGKEKKAKPELVGAHEVTVGVYVNQVRGMSMQDNHFVVDFWIWFRWKAGDDYDPLASFEVIGATVDSKLSEQRKDLGGGMKYASIRVIATVKKFFDVRKFPLDDHTLVVEVEDAEHEDHLVHFVPDVAASRVDADVKVPGWNVLPARVSARKHTYTTNYGDTSLAADNAATYGRFIVEIPLERPGVFYFFKLFWGVFLATFIGFLAFLVKPTDLDPRFGLGVGAIFAIAASSYAIAQALPDTTQVTLSDKVNMCSVGFVFLSLVESVITLKLCHAGREELALRIDRWSAVLFKAIYGLCVGMLAYTA